MIGVEKAILLASALLFGVVRARREEPSPAPVLVIPTLPPLPEMPAAEPPAKTRKAAKEHLAPLGYANQPEDLTPNAAARLFVKWMQQSESGECFTAKEVDYFWDLFVENINVNDIPPQVIRSELAAMGLCLGRKQLSIEYRDVKRRTGQQRAVLYTIPARGRTVGRPSGPLPDGSQETLGPSGPAPGDGHGVPTPCPASAHSPAKSQMTSRPDSPAGPSQRAVGPSSRRVA